MTPTRRSWWSVVAPLLLLAGSLATIEICLQALALVSPKAQRLLGPEISGSIPDPVLGARGNPQYPGHDATGYRNRDRPTQAAVVVLGDSQTYGVSVNPDESWPHLLEASLGTRVYNMAMPGYSPVQNLLQFDEALSFTPRRVIVSVYFGNDFLEAFSSALRNASIGALAPPDLLRESRAEEAKSSLLSAAAQSFNAGEPTDDSGLRVWLSYHSLLYGLARATKNFVRAQAASTVLTASHFDSDVRQIPPAKLRYWMIADRPNWRTILTPRYRGLGLDDRDVRVRTGVEIVKRVLRQMAERSRAAGVEFLVVLIPTKETVFWPHSDQPKGVLSELVANEARLKNELIDDLKSQRIQVVDVTDSLRGADRQPYFENSDGHPNALGHHLIAGVVRANLAGRP